MDKVVLNSYAKVNLSLDVTGRRADGYHMVEMIMQECNLCDTIEVEKREGEISLWCSVPFLPTDEKNIAYKAAKKFFEYTKLSGGADIKITKKIPVSAGLAGGSGNAAAVLLALNRLYETNLNEGELEKIGLALGADVPYCIRGGTCLARGIGEQLTTLRQFPKTAIVIVKPPFAVSTKDIYETIDNMTIDARPDTQGLIDDIENEDAAGAALKLSNVMEPVTAKIHPEIISIKNTLLEGGALGAVMSGSGPSVFGLFDSYEKAKAAAKQLLDNNFVYVGWTRRK